jgi:3-phytase/alkaline phosphatase D
MLSGAALAIAAVVAAPAVALDVDISGGVWPSVTTTPPSAVRFATFNASLNRGATGQLISILSTPDDPQVRAVAEIIQRVDPDVLLINEFDFDPQGEAARLFQQNYLGVSQNGATPVSYSYVFNAPSNTGVASGFDLDNDGQVITTPGAPGYGNDAFGFGAFPGQFGMLLLSKYPISYHKARTFRNFLWKDMPGALLPIDPATGEDWYSDEELQVFRLSSKSHWDVPIRINDRLVHVLASHPTPPVFDGPEDRNGTRNHDEIRLFSDYLIPWRSRYIVDDDGQRGGLPPGARFVLMGDQNADPFDGDSVAEAAQQLLKNWRVNTRKTPRSEGGPEQALLQGQNNLTHQGNPVFDTADFGEAQFGGPGNLRADYVLPSKHDTIVDSGVFWPTTDDPLFRLTGPGFPAVSSDHRLVWIDLRVRAGER